MPFNANLISNEEKCDICAVYKSKDEESPELINQNCISLQINMGNNITNRQIMYSESEQLYLKSRALSYITTFKNLT